MITVTYRNNLILGSDGLVTALVSGKTYCGCFSEIDSASGFGKYGLGLVVSYLFNDVAIIDLDKTIEMWEEKLKQYILDLTDSGVSVSATSEIESRCQAFLNEIESKDIAKPVDFYEKWLEPVILDMGHTKYDSTEIEVSIKEFFNNSCVALDLPEDEYNFVDSYLKPICYTGFSDLIRVL